MPRDYEVYLEDIRDAIGKVKRYTTRLSREAFETDDKTVDAVVRNLQIIGEAVKMIPESIRLAHANIEWKKIAGLRDILAHQYFGVDIEIIWDILENKLPRLSKRLTKSSQNEKDSFRSLPHASPYGLSTCGNPHWPWVTTRHAYVQG